MAVTYSLLSQVEELEANYLLKLHRKHGINNDKKKRTEEEHREFNRDWMKSFSFICNSDGLQICLICNEKLAHNKKQKLERRFTTKHTQFGSKYPAGEERKEAVGEL
ncbi:SCAN domain-containing protein 3 [Trichonephila clavipes]|nr:SCAN domain-containing protein 3 [Trichonephila clavipes]